MSTWAYRCRPCAEGQADWFVAALDVERLPADVKIVRVKVGSEWKCALLDRSQRATVQESLLRSVIASDEVDCPECAEMLATAEEASSVEQPADAGSGSAEPSNTATGGGRAGSVKVQAAAIALQGIQFVVVAVPMNLVASPTEADMAIVEMQPYFGNVPIVLMAQNDDDSPRYHGPGPLLEMLEGVPLEKMPWKEYSLG